MKKFIPEYKETYWFIGDVGRGREPVVARWTGNAEELKDLREGKIFRLREEAQEWLINHED